MKKKVSTVAERLQEALDDKGYRQRDLMNLTGISRDQISHYLSGDYRPKADRLFLMARALGVAEDWLMGYDVEKYPKSVVKEEYQVGNEILNIFDHLNSLGQNKLLEYAKDLISMEKYREE